jgi:hypothetical protein
LVAPHLIKNHKKNRKLSLMILCCLLWRDYSLLNMVESIWMRWFGLWKDPYVVFPSRRTLTKNILPFMMKWTLQEFVFPFVNVICSIIATFDLWMGKGAFHTFSLVINFLTLDWEPKHVAIGLFEAKGTFGVSLLSVNCKLCLRSTNLLTRSFAMWKMKAQTYLQWPMLLNKLLLVKNWECKHHLKVFVLVMPF